MYIYIYIHIYYITYVYLFVLTLGQDSWDYFYATNRLLDSRQKAVDQRRAEALGRVLPLSGRHDAVKVRASGVWGLEGHGLEVWGLGEHRATSLIRNQTHLGPYRRPVHRVLGGL